VKLEAPHIRAIQYLALGMSMDEVSRDCKTPLSTLYRWRTMPQFRDALEMELKKIQAAAPEQLQVVAHESFGAIRDAQRELRAFGLGKKEIEYSRVMALLGILKFGARWISLAGFDPALKETAAKLAFQKPESAQAQELPELIPSALECGPCPDPRPATELLPPPSIRGAYTIEELAEWVRADRIARGLATPEEIGDEREARKELLRSALRELDEQDPQQPLDAEFGLKEQPAQPARPEQPERRESSRQELEATHPLPLSPAGERDERIPINHAYAAKATQVAPESPINVRGEGKCAVFAGNATSIGGQVKRESIIAETDAIT
jgi:hypothetical protein